MTAAALVFVLALAFVVGPTLVVIEAVVVTGVLALVAGLLLGAGLRVSVEEAEMWHRKTRDVFGRWRQDKLAHARRGAALRATRGRQVVGRAVAMAVLVNRGQVIHVRQMAGRAVGPAQWPGHQPPEPIGSPIYTGFLEQVYKGVDR